MNIKRAKQEIKDAVQAYLLKDERGEYRIPAVHQRPILMMGPPGIGKTQIMEQIASECKIGLVAYTITHHTRQSAVGLPFIQKKSYGGSEYSITEYTMSEIIAAVYEKMEETGLKEGILFIDEINCVSETLAPTMLQFLQCKTFGNHKVPEGWIIVAAGNPPEYNKSVREFDIVTLDRMKKIDVEENYEVWKEYAYKAGVHPAIISYLEFRREFFYRIESTVDGKLFVTARGWEDLSRLIQVYEMLEKKVDKEVIHQYVQHWKIAKDFANYLELYQKYQKDYGLDKILEGQMDAYVVEKIKVASFDEKIQVVSLLIGRLTPGFQKVYEVNRFVEQLFGYLKQYKISQDLGMVIQDAKKLLQQQKKAGHLKKAEEICMEQVIETLQDYKKRMNLEAGDCFEQVRTFFTAETDKLNEWIDQTMNQLEYAFDFMEAAFGDSQEMVVFITELNANYYSVQFLKENDCPRYYKYNKNLLFDERQKELLEKMDLLESEMQKSSEPFLG